MIELTEGLGPQNPGDGPLLRRLRLHQSWYRATVLRRPRWGSTRGVAPRELGSVLSREDGVAGLNFVSQSAFDLYRARHAAGWGVDPRCAVHMTSSQALTINLFGLLGEEEAWLIECLNTWLGRSDLNAVLRVEIEFAPQKRSEHLNDQTRIDVLVMATGGKGQELIAIEVKYADRFNSRRVDIETERYRNLAKHSGLWTDPCGVLGDDRLNQLARVHALATSYSRSLGISQPVSLIVATHGRDASAQEIVDLYGAQVNGPLVTHVALRSVCASVLDAAPWGRRDTAEALWERYGCETGSEGVSRVLAEMRAESRRQLTRSGDRVA